MCAFIQCYVVERDGGVEGIYPQFDVLDKSASVYSVAKGQCSRLHSTTLYWLPTKDTLNAFCLFAVLCAWVSLCISYRNTLSVRNHLHEPP